MLTLAPGTLLQPSLRGGTTSVVVGTLAFLALCGAARAQVRLLHEVKHDESPPLRDIPAVPLRNSPREMPMPTSIDLEMLSSPAADPGLQATAGRWSAPSPA
jgi:hypothetical protein